MSYGGRAALRGVSLVVPAGALAALVGANGAGKSTALKAAAGLIPVQSGAVRVFGLPPGACRHRAAYLPQRGDIDWQFPVSVGRFVLAGRYPNLGWLKRPGANDRARARRALRRLGLLDLADRPIGALSGGQQRALVARALAQEADLLLLDEPFNHLDAAGRADLLALLGGLRDAGKTLVVATHDFDRPDDHFDLVVRLRDGRREPGAVPA